MMDDTDLFDRHRPGLVAPQDQPGLISAGAGPSPACSRPWRHAPIMA
jgi:hypothetical protein